MSGNFTIPVEWSPWWSRHLDVITLRRSDRVG